MKRTQTISDEFDSAAPLESAATVPSRWYTDADILARERETVFAGNWVAVHWLTIRPEPLFAPIEQTWILL